MEEEGSHEGAMEPGSQGGAKKKILAATGALLSAAIVTAVGITQMETNGNGNILPNYTNS